MPKSTLVAAIAATIAVAVAAWLRADDAPETSRIFNALNKRFGVHPSYRTNHAKGFVFEGSFSASPEAAKLCKSPFFTSMELLLTICFFDVGGMHDQHDAAPVANSNDMAIKFHLPRGEENEIVVNSFNTTPWRRPRISANFS